MASIQTTAIKSEVTHMNSLAQATRSGRNLPALFVSHGAPTLALDPGRTGRSWQMLAQRLPRPLAAEGVLILASGSLTHNLRDVRWQSAGERGEPYVEGFREWIAARIAGGAIEELLDYRSLAPDARRAHPTDDHLLPLFVALGAAPDTRQSRRVDNGVTLGVLAMDGYEFATGVEAGTALTGAAAAVA